jgi:membrane-bound lytic murein transglycosylase D
MNETELMSPKPLPRIQKSYGTYAKFHQSLITIGIGTCCLASIFGCATSESIKQTPPARAQSASRLPSIIRDPAIRDEIRAEINSLRVSILNPQPVEVDAKPEPLTKLEIARSEPALPALRIRRNKAAESPLIFDYPVTYNSAVRRWIHYFQTGGRAAFRSWLEKSSQHLPAIQQELLRARLPQDLAYVAMIESGFSPTATSHASAMGLWQFIATTGNRYGLRTEWWLDERKDSLKSTRAAISYMSDLYDQFGSWYLVAASYNMGENGVRRLIDRYHTNNYWELADRGALPEETKHYVPKIIAAMLIAKAPALYGFRDLNFLSPLDYDKFNVPGGTDLNALANYLGVSEKYLKDLNPELIRGMVPRQQKLHQIHIPKGSISAVAEFLKNRG